jgi:hypothetical protein
MPTTAIVYSWQADLELTALARGDDLNPNALCQPRIRATRGRDERSIERGCNGLISITQLRQQRREITRRRLDGFAVDDDPLFDGLHIRRHDAVHGWEAAALIRSPIEHSGGATYAGPHWLQRVVDEVGA